MKELSYFIKSTFLLLFLAIQTLNAQDLEQEFLFEMEIRLSNTILLGQTPLGVRTIHPVSGGTFKGLELNGKILTNGGDWLLAIDSTTHQLDARIILETDDGALIYTTYTGYLHRRPDKSYYIMSRPVFETSSRKYAWLNHLITVGTGQLIEGGISFRIYAIK